MAGIFWRNLKVAFSLLALLVLSAPVFAGQVTLTWETNSEPDLSHYIVYMGTESGAYIWNSGNIGLVTHYTWENLDPLVKYYFAVTAVDEAGLESDFSNEVSTEGYSGNFIILEDGTGPGVWTKTSGLGSVTSESQPDDDMAVVFSSTSATAKTSFKLLGNDPVGALFNVLDWEFKYFQATDSYFMVQVFTTNGTRKMIYQAKNGTDYRSSGNLFYFLGTGVKNGEWYQMSVDLQEDIYYLEPNNELLGIDTIFVYAAGLGKAYGIKNIVVRSID